MANNFVHGRLTSISIAGTQFAGLTASYTEKLSSLDDITYTVSGGATFGVFLPGYNMASGTISFVYDTLNQPVLSPQNMIPGTLMVLVVSPDGTKLYSFNAYSSEFTWTGGPTAGTLKASTNYQSTGTITRPTS
jgi:hypothetical protein